MHRLPLAALLVLLCSLSAAQAEEKQPVRDVSEAVGWFFRKAKSAGAFYINSFKEQKRPKAEPAPPPELPPPLETGTTESQTADGETVQSFHCKLPEGYGHKIRKPDERLGPKPEVAFLVQPPPPPENLCLTDPKLFNELQAKHLKESVVSSGPRKDRPFRLDGSRDVTLSDAEADLDLFDRILLSGVPEKKKPPTSGPASWPQAAEDCPTRDVECTLTRLYDPAGECASGACEAREAAYLTLRIAKKARYFPTLTQWFPGFPTQRWDAPTLRAISHVFDMLPDGVARFGKDKDLRKFPDHTVIGKCPEGSAQCKAGDHWPVPPSPTQSTSGMAQIFWFGGSASKPAGWSDAYILVTDKLVNKDRMASCKGLVHEVAHHFDYSFAFDPQDLERKNPESMLAAARERIRDEWGVREFGKYSSLEVDDDASRASASRFSDISWACASPGENCRLKSNGAGFVTAYASQVGPMDDFAESLAYYVCDPIELYARSPRKYAWIKSHVFARAPVRELWTPKHEEWEGFNTALGRVVRDRTPVEALLESCLGTFRQIGRKVLTWTSGPDQGKRFARLSAFFDDPDPERRAQGYLKGYAVEDVLSVDDFKCTARLAGLLDAEIRTGMLSNPPRPDRQYCEQGSTEAVNYLAAKRAAYVTLPFFQALYQVGIREEAVFDKIDDCNPANRGSCRFLQVYDEELDKLSGAMASVGISTPLRAKTVTKIVELLKSGI